MIYKELIAKYQASTAKMKVWIARLAMLRLFAALLVIFGGYQSYLHGAGAWQAVLLIGLVVFALALRWQNALSRKYLIEKILLSINENEQLFMSGQRDIFEGGEQFKNAQHPYSFDLDIFGKNSLFAYLNRTHTTFGARKLAQVLSSKNSKDGILKQQQAIAELTSQLDLRQLIEAHAIAVNDSEERSKLLHSWLSLEVPSQSKALKITAYAMTFLLIVFLALSFAPIAFPFGKLAALIFVFQLSISGSKVKGILSEVSYFEKVKDELFHYKNLVAKLEKEQFQSPVLKDLQHRFSEDDKMASDKLKELSRIIDNISNIQNLVAFMFFSGLFCFHLHQYFKLLQWKTTNKAQMVKWFEAIGEWEMLHCLSQLKYNEPKFTFPHISDQPEIRFHELGHPLIASSKRVCNDISYSPFNFIILTGSNMSGKSTFLRTLGVNMVLANAGSAVCAKDATLFPFQILVSMRLDDSLADSQSYFFAEINRLKMITEEFPKQPSFIILDEILRGTNSDDKRHGTVELLKKLEAQKATGIIATHDVEVCELTTQYPNYFINKNFEVDILKDELHFDYKLYDGICKNKSATFLMKKVGIIE